MSVYPAEPPASTRLRYAGTTKVTGTSIHGVRPALVCSVTIPSYTPGESPVPSTRTVSVVLSPGGTVPWSGTVHSHGAPGFHGTSSRTSYSRGISLVLRRVSGAERSCPGCARNDSDSGPSCARAVCSATSWRATSPSPDSVTSVVSLA